MPLVVVMVVGASPVVMPLVVVRVMVPPVVDHRL